MLKVGETLLNLGLIRHFIIPGANLFGGQKDWRKVEDKAALREAGPSSHHEDRMRGSHLFRTIQKVCSNGQIHT